MSTIEPNPRPPSAADLRARFDDAAAYTVGIEDEVMVLDPATHELAPRAHEVLDRLDGGADGIQFKLELPASQIEILVGPAATVPEAIATLHEGRRLLAERGAGLARFAGAGVHPTSPGSGQLNGTGRAGDRYRHVIGEYGPIARRQLVCALQVHVSVPGADRALAVYNAARAYLPALAALAANAPFYEGHDTGLASVRPKVGELLPRQGVPPPFESWDAYAAALAWGAATGAFPDSSGWWYELRPHPRFGTLELRVPDGQPTVTGVAAIAAVAQALVAWLGQRYDRGELERAAPTWRIEQNRWSACRYGVEGAMADLESGATRPTRTCLRELLDLLEPVAARLDGADALAGARKLIEVNGAMAQRRVAARSGVESVPGWLANQFLDR